MRINRTIVVTLSLLAVAASGCKPKVGKKCSAGESYCTKDGALFCGDDNKLQATACHGPKGCVQHGKSADCDVSLAVASESCEDNENLACAIDRKAVLECKDHVWTVDATCKGAKGCEAKGNELFCDHTYAEKDDPCRHEGQYACSSDKAFILKCDGTAMRPINSCRGPKGCTFEEHAERKMTEFSCDDSLAAEGDPCDSNDVHACAMDKKSTFVCKDKKFVAHKGCPGPRGCTVDAAAQKLSCDTGSGVFSAAGGVAKVSSATIAGQGADKGKGKGNAASAKPSASAVTAASASAKAPASASASASAKPAASASASAAASASAKPPASASAKPGATAPVVSAKAGVPAKPAASVTKKK